MGSGCKSLGLERARFAFGGRELEVQAFRVRHSNWRDLRAISSVVLVTVGLVLRVWKQEMLPFPQTPFFVLGVRNCRACWELRIRVSTRCEVPAATG